VGRTVKARILVGDVRERLAELADGSVQTCVTSPPYWGLRDYGHAGQIGLEKTPEQYVAELVAVFREVRRVLRPDGTLWLNLGDSYCSQGGSHDGREDNQPNVGAARAWRNGSGRADGMVDERGQRNRNGNTVENLKPKDLVGIPWRVAFALQADGWYLRSEIIWAKPNPMPESVTDRPTKSHEQIFLLSKSARYYYDAEAIKEPAADPDRETRCEGDNAYRGQAAIRAQGKTRRHRMPDGPTVHGNKPGRDDGGAACNKPGQIFRNKRDVWTIATTSYSGAHFATFPPALIQPCILAGCPVGGTVLDPFGGSGTTGQVAAGNARNAVLIELNTEYTKLAQDRCGLFCASKTEPDGEKHDEPDRDA
jgi:DNA modification methylase